HLANDKHPFEIEERKLAEGRRRVIIGNSNYIGAETHSQFFYHTGYFGGVINLGAIVIDGYFALFSKQVFT
ncbi:MAG TPA: hypothetical protein QF359_10330, partial [Rhodospirillales bacterium]|nr:hypothetical protein [Rhodospirillales bacterium]